MNGMGDKQNMSRFNLISAREQHPKVAIFRKCVWFILQYLRERHVPEITTAVSLASNNTARSELERETQEVP